MATSHAVSSNSPTPPTLGGQPPRLARFRSRLYVFFDRALWPSRRQSDTPGGGKSARRSRPGAGSAPGVHTPDLGASTGGRPTCPPAREAALAACAITHRVASITRLRSTGSSVDLRLPFGAAWRRLGLHDQLRKGCLAQSSQPAHATGHQVWLRKPDDPLPASPLRRGVRGRDERSFGATTAAVPLGRAMLSALPCVGFFTNHYHRVILRSSASLMLGTSSPHSRRIRYA